MPRKTDYESKIRDIVKEELKVTKPDDASLDPDLNTSRFKNRRRMAWVCLYSMLAFTLLFIFWVEPSTIENYGAIIAWLYGCLSSVVLAYMGMSTYSYSSFLNSQQSDSSSSYRGRRDDFEPPEPREPELPEDEPFDPGVK